jgi:hypothetical protein
MSNEGGIVVRYECDGEKVWEKIKNRKAVFLDTMVWINMADGKPEAQPLRSKLQERVQAGVVFCPLSAPLIWELYKQEFSELRTGTLMEELSLNVAFSQESEVYKWEVECFAKRIAKLDAEPCPNKMLFVPAVAYLASAFSLTFPVGTPRETIQQIGKMACDRVNAMRLSELLTLRKGQMRDYIGNLPMQPYKQKTQELLKSTNGSREKVWQTEATTVFKNNFRPAFRALPITLMPHVAKFGESVEQDKVAERLRALFNELPALHNYIEVMARASDDPNRNDKPNDFFDLEMMAIPLAYAHAFITLDRWMRSRFLQPGKFLKQNNCKFCATYAELESWLDTK